MHTSLNSILFPQNQLFRTIHNKTQIHGNMDRKTSYEKFKCILLQCTLYNS